MSSSITINHSYKISESEWAFLPGIFTHTRNLFWWQKLHSATDLITWDMVGMGIYVSYTKPTEREVLMDEETFYCLLSVACSAAVKLDVLTVECSVSCTHYCIMGKDIWCDGAGSNVRFLFVCGVSFLNNPMVVPRACRRRLSPNGATSQASPAPTRPHPETEMWVNLTLMPAIWFPLKSWFWNAV